VRRVLSPETGTELVGTRAVAAPADDRLRLAPGENGVCVIDPDTSETVLAIGRLTPDLADVFHAMLPRYRDWSVTLRGANGYRNSSRVFGWMPKSVVHWREGCSASTLGRDDPALDAALRDTADHCGRWMVEHLPDAVERDRATLRPVLPDWRLTEQEGSLWTSGVINRDSPMPYHRDGSNFPSWSAMPVIRHRTRGGHLHLPEYGLTVPCDDSTILYFWGQKYVHGVTPMTPAPRGAAYRFTIVYYARQGMKDCATYARETAAARARRTARETKMAAEVRTRLDQAATTPTGGP